MRQAGERNFEIIGEALKRLAATDPTTAAGMAQVPVLLSEACALIASAAFCAAEDKE